MKLRDHYSVIVSTLALVVALTFAGANATGVFVTSKQIKNGTILSQDIRKSAVKSSDIGANAVGSVDIKTGAVQTGDIGEGQVTPGDVTMPAPAQMQRDDAASTEVGDQYAHVATVGTYAKQDPTSALHVEWTGSASSGSFPCVFQLRVDGQASGVGAGAFYVNGNVSVSAAALFTGVAAGNHQVEIWARTTSTGGVPVPCTVGPTEVGIDQTVVVTEQVI